VNDPPAWPCLRADDVVLGTPLRLTVAGIRGAMHGVSASRSLWPRCVLTLQADQGGLRRGQGVSTQSHGPRHQRLSDRDRRRRRPDAASRVPTAFH